MKMMEFGQKNSEVIMLLHGGGLSWWNYRDEIELLEKDYHVILPILDGHPDAYKDFTTIENNALELVEYIDRNYNGQIALIGGLSLGGQILLEMLMIRPNICLNAIVESALVLPMKMTNMLIPSAINMSYSLIAKPWFSKYQFKALHINENYYDDYYKTSIEISKDNMINFLKANSSFKINHKLSYTNAHVMVYVGSHESEKMLDSAKLIHEAIPLSSLNILEAYTHGDLSLNHPQQYVSIIKRLAPIKNQS